MREVTVDISTEGKVTVEVNGVVGPSCQSITDALKANLGGDVESDTKKPEFYAEESEEVHSGGW